MKPRLPAIVKATWDSRKAGLVIAVIAGATTLAALGKITTEDWLVFVGGVTGLYTVGQGIADKGAK